MEPLAVCMPDWFHQGQKAAWNSKATDIVVVAGSQGGKTAMQAPWLLREIRRCAPLIRWRGKRAKFIYAGPTLSLLGVQAIPAFSQLFEEEHQLGRTIHGQKAKFVFSAEGTRKLLGFEAEIVVHFAYTKDSSNLESMTAMAGVWDEAGQKVNKLASYRAYNRRLKGARSTTFRQVYEWLESEKLLEEFAWWVSEFYEVEGPEATFGRRLWGTTPYEFGWFYFQVVKRAQDAQPGFEHFNFPTWLNPTMSKAECEAELDKGMPLWEWEMMYEGLFTKPAGTIFDCFDPEVNLSAQFEIPAEWPRLVGLDFGNVNTAAVKIAQELSRNDDGTWGAPTGRGYVYEIYKQRGEDAAEHAKALKKGEPKTLKGRGGAHQESGWRQAFRAQGIALEDPPKVVQGVEIGISCIYGALKRGDLIIFETLSELIDQLQRYARELDDEGEPKEAISDKSKFHFIDGLRYIAVKIWPPAREPSTANPLPPASRIRAFPRRH